MIPEQMRWLIFGEDGSWVAQCVDFDMCTQTKDIEHIEMAINDIIMSHIALSVEYGSEPFKGLPDAPGDCQGQYDAAKARATTFQVQWNIVKREAGSKIDGPKSFQIRMAA